MQYIEDPSNDGSKQYQIHAGAFVQYNAAVPYSNGSMYMFYAAESYACAFHAVADSYSTYSRSKECREYIYN